MAVLLDGGYLRMDTSDLANPANDHLIFSKGHASPLLLRRAQGGRGSSTTPSC